LAACQRRSHRTRALCTVVSDGALAVLFVLAAALSLATSWLLVSRLERVGARFGLSEALLHAGRLGGRCA